MPLQILSAGCGIQHPLRHSDNPHGLYPYRGLPAFAWLSMAGSEGARRADTTTGAESWPHGGTEAPTAAGAAPPHLTILFDNYPGLPELTSLWGFAALIRVPGQTILFDTGSNGRVLLNNMAALGRMPESVDLVFLSHAHWDHLGGLDSVLEVSPQATVVVHEGFSKHLIHDLHDLCAAVVVVGADPQEIAPGLFSTGMLDSQPGEQAIVVDAGKVTAVISGCAHPGMERIVERTNGFLGKKIDWAIGGFHLMDADATGIEESIRALRRLGVGYVVPTHCTGDTAKAAFERAYGNRCVEGGVGREIKLVG